MKFTFKGTKNRSGKRTTFTEDIQIPIEFESHPMEFLDPMDKSDIMYKRDLHVILDYFPYSKPLKKESNPTWKEVAKRWEEVANLHEKRASEWKEIALKYKAIILGEKLNSPTVQSSLESGLPVDMKLNWNAGWLSPNGDFYGTNGDMSQMLHNELSDKLYEIGIIPQLESISTNPDRWLGENGWTKIHGNWILYEGYLIAKRTSFQDEFDMPIVKAVPMTKEQRDQISLYGKLCHGGKLRFGYKQEPISAARFEMIDDASIWKLFDF